MWLVRDGALRQLTHDHTIVAALIETGQLTTEEARSHEHRNLLNRALTPGVVADETTVDLRPGDRVVLTTDGIHTYVDVLETMLTTSESPQHVADAAAAAAADAGEPDNHTIVVVSTVRRGWTSTVAPRRHPARSRSGTRPMRLRPAVTRVCTATRRVPSDSPAPRALCRPRTAVAPPASGCSTALETWSAGRDRADEPPV